MSNSCFRDFVNFCLLLLQIGRQAWSSGLVVVKIIVKIVVIASSSASRVSFFSLQLLVTHSSDILLFSWMTWWTPSMKTWTVLRRQGTELSGGWTGEPELSVRLLELETLTLVDCFVPQMYLTLGSIVLLPRCISAHTRPDKQNLFPIVQGGLEEEKRKDCAAQVLEMHC